MEKPKTKPKAKAAPLEISGTTVPPGERRRLEIPVSRLSTDTWLSLPIEVVHGRLRGPSLWLSAAVHGDEINGVEIIRQVLTQLEPHDLRGTLIAAPIVNVFGFVNQSRYLPDRRDLNRSFPGSARGSMASRLAHLFMTEVVSRCGYGVDLHTGSNHRENLPQIRANLHDEETRRCAVAFGAPVMMHAETRDGSLREAATKRKIHILLYEAGEPLRFDDESIRRGVAGVRRLMHALGMLQQTRKKKPPPSIEVGETSWVRARRGGILRLDVTLGQRVTRRQRLGSISDAFGHGAKTLTSPMAGIVIGLSNNPLVNQGDSVVNIAKIVQDETAQAPQADPSASPG